MEFGELEIIDIYDIVQCNASVFEHEFNPIFLEFLFNELPNYIKKDTSLLVKSKTPVLTFYKDYDEIERENIINYIIGLFYDLYTQIRHEN